MNPADQTTVDNSSITALRLRNLRQARMRRSCFVNSTNDIYNDTTTLTHKSNSWTSPRHVANSRRLTIKRSFIQALASSLGQSHLDDLLSNDEELLQENHQQEQTRAQNHIQEKSQDKRRNSLSLTHSDPMVRAVLQETKVFFEQQPHIQESHGWSHALAVYENALKAIRSDPTITNSQEREILLAALLHDTDDRKYFSKHHEANKINAKKIMQRAQVDHDTIQNAAYMISLVSGSKNGNTVPAAIQTSGDYYQLIPRWADRLEATGETGVVRLYQYSCEIQQPLALDGISPRATTLDELWDIATQERFEQYQANGAQSPDMLSHYYNRILQFCLPPPEIVRNAYLEARQASQEGIQPMLYLCLNYGKTGKVDEAYIQSLMAKQANNAPKSDETTATTLLEDDESSLSTTC